MRLCRFDTDRLGVWTEDGIADVSDVLDDLPSFRWVRDLEDPVISRLDSLRPRIENALATAPRRDPASVTLEAPVGMPSKIIGAPVNYHDHITEALEDSDLNQGNRVHPIDEIGCFLKAGSSLGGHGSTVIPPAWAKRVDHEAEVAVVIGKAAHFVKAADAMNHVAGYALALDMTVRGKQDRSLRKSCDGFGVVGPVLVTADEVQDPGEIGFRLTLNGDARQEASTALLIRSIPELIEMCSAFYTLLPGDVIMTGTPAGVGPVTRGDRIDVTSPQLGHLSITIG